ncbi:MAG: hypothetical protein ACR2MY_12705 [Candidatus Dormibacteria bacterium]
MAPSPSKPVADEPPAEPPSADQGVAGAPAPDAPTADSVGFDIANPLASPPGRGAAPEPVPLEVPLEEQISNLPPLSYPGSNNEDFDRWASDKRRGRLRVEVIGAVALLIAGAAVTAFSGRPAFIAVALFGIVGLAIYEFLVTSFE